MFKTWEEKYFNSQTFLEHSSSYVFYWFVVPSLPSIPVVFLNLPFLFITVFTSTDTLPLGCTFA